MRTRLGPVAAALFLTLTLPFTAAGALTAAPVHASAQVVTRQLVVDEAMKYLHYRYAETGSSPKTGFSCIGFVWYVFQSVGVDMPGNLSTAIAAYPRIPERSMLPGDIVFFRNTWWKGLSHVAIYIGDGKIIQAENPRRGVVITALRNDPIDGSYYQQHFLAAERPLAGQYASPEPAPSFTTAFVAVPRLNLRANPSRGAIVELVLRRGARVSTLGSWNGWLKVSTGNLTGWVVSTGLHAAAPLRSSARSVGSRDDHRSYKQRHVLGGVNIHSGPALADGVVAVTTPGMTVSVLASRDSFTEIRTRDGVTGWIASRFIKHAGKHERISGTRAAGVGRIGHSGILTIRAHLRTGPSLYARIIEWVPARTRLVVLEKVPLWDHVQLSARLSGYIYAEFIRR